ncbi:hypothetical protein GCK72_024460 [Caenorhabditis remanei]|uniref:Uncharacterized protein n=1 Tax=Caenorhabditis remanei TaxID=31234 RepID=A0A6A5FZK4_CAERE|nr:hypothetical protein GCK72_024460 [Caenorhabditis remanei]KAF1747993.1 hypothetical protein GCK72_024460 [Caenorhabditis remanei]
MEVPKHLTKEHKKILSDVKSFGELVKTFSEKLGGSPKEQRSSPLILFIKNYLRYYSTALIDQVIDLEFRNSFSLFEKNSKNLMSAFEKLNASYTSIFQEEQSESEL